ncbi:MAG: hypothetical protein ACTHNM_06820 [Dyella sp.]|uniref:hypothetical protein n=1 Tax=Dyella sp. TaxID=1869338 RepID=UPI003F80F7C2
MNEKTRLLQGLTKLPPEELAKLQITVERQRAHALVKASAGTGVSPGGGRSWGTWGRSTAAH